jgi:hypothetical protein
MNRKGRYGGPARPERLAVAKLRESALKPMKSLARVILCAFRRAGSSQAREARIPRTWEERGAP